MNLACLRAAIAGAQLSSSSALSADSSPLSSDENEQFPLSPTASPRYCCPNRKDIRPNLSFRARRVQDRFQHTTIQMQVPARAVDLWGIVSSGDAVHFGLCSNAEYEQLPLP
jgi:hypothetical protein